MACSPFDLRTRARAAVATAALLLSAFSFTARASAQQAQFRHLGAAEGLANPWVTAILRDSRGFMWFGTATGLNRYNGYAMELFRHRPGDASTLPDANVTALYEDRAGTIWVGTRSGLSRYDRSRNTFSSYMGRSGVDLVQRHRVLAILQDRAGRMWIGTTSGLFRFEPSTGRETEVRLPYNDSTRRTINVVWEDPSGHLWVGTAASGLIDLDPGSGRAHAYPNDPGDRASLPDNDVQAILPADRGRLWLATNNGGLVLFDPRAGVVAHYAHDPRRPTSIGEDVVHRMVSDGAGGFWLGLENAGLDHFNPATGRFEHNPADRNRPGKLTSNSVWSLYRDPAGTLWVGTYDGGVNLIAHGSHALRHYAAQANDSTSLSPNSILGFAQDSSGAIWVATDGGGLARLDPATGRFRRYTTRNSKLNVPAVLAASVAPDGGIWIGTWNGGISRLDPSTGRFTTYTKANAGLPDDHIFSVLVDPAGIVWAGTWAEGLIRLDPRTRTVTRYRIGEVQSQIWVIHRLRDGRLMLGTMANGLLIFNPRTGSMLHFRGEENQAGALSSSEVRAVLETDKGVWIGTAGGLDWLDLATERVSHPTIADSLPGSLVSGLASDREGLLWVTTDRGLVRLDPRTGRTRLYGTPDGLSADFNPRSYFRSREGRLYFGAATGMDEIHPDDVADNRRPPPVVFTGFQLFNRPVPIGGRESPLKAQISETRELSLSHRQSVFTIEFAALDYIAPAKNEYAYKLEGFDRGWTYAGANRSATYTSLPPGRYAFRVKASNNDGVWNEAGATLRITIRPPFWKTWWFELLAILLVIGTVGAIALSARRRRRHLEHMNRRLAAAAELDRERQQYLQRNVLEILGGLQRFAAGDYSVALDVTSDDAIGRLREGVNTVMADRKRAEEELRQSQKMEAVGRLAGGVAHDFNNLLTVIKGNTTLALSGREAPELLQEELGEVQRAAERAEALTRQLLAFSRKQILQPRALSLNDVVQDVGRMLQRSVGEDVEIRTVLEEDLGMVRADRGQLEQVVLNLAVNARDAMPRGGVLTIETRNLPASHAFHLEHERLPGVALIVSDTGCGMAPEVIERVFEPFFTTKEPGKGTGLGLATVYGIVKQSGGDVRVRSESGRGSTFTICLPRIEDVERPAEESPAESPEDGSGTVLLVEDEHALRRLATRVLERSGYTVIAAASGAEAIQLAARHDGPIDLLLTDVVMPGMSGREVAETLLPRHPGMRLLYTSGYTEDDIIRHGVSGRGTAFLEKPFAPADLLRKLRQVLQDDGQLGAVAD